MDHRYKQNVGGRGAPTKINYDWGTTRRAPKFGIELGFWVFFRLVVLFCTLPVGFFATYKHFILRVPQCSECRRYV